MLWIDRVEKLGRLVLWLTLAATVVIVPIEYAKAQRLEAQLQESARKAALALEKELKAKVEKSDRLPLKGMPAVMRSLNVQTASGHVYFTNVSPRSGFVCVTGVAMNVTTKQISKSMPACVAAAPYASALEMKLLFAGNELEATCKNGGCDLALEDTPDVTL